METDTDKYLLVYLRGTMPVFYTNDEYEWTNDIRAAYRFNSEREAKTMTSVLRAKWGAAMRVEK